jgi:predicted nucleotidyltransferase component of viral defense system
LYHRRNDGLGIRIGGPVELDRFEQIKKLTLIGLFSDDDLMDTLVLKGGNALDIVYRIAARASIDIDLSIENDFEITQLGRIHARDDCI